MTAEQRIKRAIKHLETYGWRKGAWRDKHNGGKYDAKSSACLIGAMCTLRELRFGSVVWQEGVGDAARAMGFDAAWDAIAWNDESGRRKAQVLKRLREGLDKLKKEQHG